eukprot:scaffold4827_cov109-Isochrysis_galbana.AAC.10
MAVFRQTARESAKGDAPSDVRHPVPSAGTLTVVWRRGPDCRDAHVFLLLTHMPACPRAYVEVIISRKRVGGGRDISTKTKLPVIQYSVAPPSVAAYRHG